MNTAYQASPFKDARIACLAGRFCAQDTPVFALNGQPLTQAVQVAAAIFHTKPARHVLIETDAG